MVIVVWYRNYLKDGKVISCRFKDLKKIILGGMFVIKHFC